MHGFTTPNPFIAKRGFFGSLHLDDSSPPTTSTTLIDATGSGSTNTKGSYIDIIASLSNACYGLYVTLSGCNANGTVRNALLDIAYDSGGGDTDLVPNIYIGDAAGGSNGGATGNYGYFYHIPGISLAAGTAISARVQGSTASQKISIGIIADMNAQFGNLTSNSFVNYGADTANSRGTALTTGTGALGTYVQVGTASQTHKFLIVCPGPQANTTMGNQSFVFAVGTGATAGTVTTLGYVHYITNNTENAGAMCPPIWTPIATNDKIWVAGSSTSNSAMGALVIGGG